MELGNKSVKIRFIYTDDEKATAIISKSLQQSSLDNIERSVFNSMFQGFRIMYNIKNAYFRVCEYTDGKYILNVRKDLHDYITINFKVHPFYSGIRIGL